MRNSLAAPPEWGSTSCVVGPRDGPGDDQTVERQIANMSQLNPPRIRVLAVRQPYAWLIVAGHKTIENRTWNIGYRGRLYIHASAQLHRTPLAELEGQFNIEIDRSALTMGAIIGHVDLVDVVTQSVSPWFEGPYGFVLANPTMIKHVPARGRLRIYSAPEALVIEPPQGLLEA